MNLVTCCLDCNAGKSDRELAVVIRENGEDIAVRKERLSQTKAYNELLESELAYELESIARLEEYWCLRVARYADFCFNAMHSRSIRVFLKHLPVTEVEDAMECAGAAKISGRIDNASLAVWSYFCGICWNKIKRNSGAIETDSDDKTGGGE
jgi:hypothetical protein